jgi:hypothetical protein
MRMAVLAAVGDDDVVFVTLVALEHEFEIAQHIFYIGRASHMDHHADRKFRIWGHLFMYL